VTATAKKKKQDGRRNNRPPPPPLRNQRALNNDGGRPSGYRPEYVEHARKLCQLGATDAELADFFKVSRSTLFEWRAANPEFSDTLKIGKAPADDRAERSFYQRAIGYDVPVRKVVTRREGKAVVTTVTETVEHVPGDVGAQKSWLCNRRPRQWRDKIQVEQTSNWADRSPLEIKRALVQKMVAWGLVARENVPPDLLVPPVDGEDISAPG
jgi:hypothetical protein